MSKRIIVTGSSDCMFWYTQYNGEEFLVVREESDRYWVRERNRWGCINFILKKDSREV